jgi:hypothetical protein
MTFKRHRPMWDGLRAATLYSELPGFMVSLREQEGIAARALEFAILTTNVAQTAAGASRQYGVAFAI